MEGYNKHCGVKVATITKTYIKQWENRGFIVVPAISINKEPVTVRIIQSIVGNKKAAFLK